jgi:DNA-directed RNA polymerase alpha subunit
MSTLPTPIQHSPIIPGQRKRQEEEIKGIQIGKEIVKVSLFADGMILYLKDPKKSTKILIDHINSFSNVARHKINLPKSVAFIYANNEKIEKVYMEAIRFTIASKKKKTKHLRINLTKVVNDLCKEKYTPLKRSKKTTEGGKISHAHGLAEST